ncbi:MAG: hypothetical protein ACREXW_17400 [Gammaproteobacteria bacterium]
MKTTLELPDDLMRAVKVRAAATERKLKDVVAELIRRGLETAPLSSAEDPLQAWAKKLVFHTDGTVTNPDGIDDPALFEDLEDIRRRRSRLSPPRDPFADH